MQLSLSIHLLSIVFWFGGALVLTRYLKLHATEVSRGEAARRFTRGVLFGFIVGGMIIALVTGVVQLLIAGMAAYMKAGWFHAKLLCILLSVGVTVILIRETQKFCDSEAVNPSLFGKLHGIFSFLLFLMLFLVKVKPF